MYLQLEGKKMFRLSIFLLFCVSQSLSLAAEYPDMVGVWKGHLRTMNSGGGQVAQGGVVLAEVDATVTIEHQDGETFIGKVRLSNMGKDEPSIRLWGAIRSNGQEAVFIGGNGARGPIWFLDENSYEFCNTDLSNDGVMTAYCGVFSKESGT